MASYTIPEYLLDRANIHDTLLKIPISYDTLNFPGLLEVYASSFENDLSSIIGGGPATLSPEEWIEQAKVVLSNFSATQHIITNVLINLPQPTSNAARPEKVSVQGQVLANMVGKAPSDGTAAALLQNGGLLGAELERNADLESQGQNPWRVTKYKVTKTWDRGDVTRA